MSVTVSVGNSTIVKKIVMGTPVRRVSGAGGASTVNDLTDINTNGKVTGSLLVYNASSGKWEATADLENQNINGGSY